MEIKYKDYTLNSDDKKLLLKLCELCPHVSKCTNYDILLNNSIVDDFKFCALHKLCLKKAYKKYKKGIKKR